MRDGQLWIAQISDPHLSRSHPFFLRNWRIAAEFAASRAPDLVLVSGDLTVNGADSADDLELAGEEMRAFGALVLPGNHDVGECRRDHEQPVDAARLDRYRRIVGHDWWMRDAGAWRLVGLNAQLLGSGLPDEAEQRGWAESACREAEGRPIAVFLHKPLFLAAPDEADAPDHAVPGSGRTWLAALAARYDVRLVACGHVHQYRARASGPVLHASAPASSFVAGEPTLAYEGGLAAPGYLEWRLGPSGEVEHAFVAPPGIRTLKLEEIRGEAPNLRSMPPAAIEAALDRHGLRE